MRKDSCVRRHNKQDGADGSPPGGGTLPTPRIALPKWKLAILQADYRPKVGFFLVFPYKTGIESRKSMTVRSDHMARVVWQFMCVQ